MRYVLLFMLVAIGCSRVSSYQKMNKEIVLDLLYDQSKDLQQRKKNLKALHPKCFEDSIQQIVAVTIVEFALMDSTLTYEHTFLDSIMIHKAKRDSLDPFNFQFWGIAESLSFMDLEFRRSVGENKLFHKEYFDRRVKLIEGGISIPLDATEEEIEQILSGEH